MAAQAAPAIASAIGAGMQSGISISGNIMSYRSNRKNREWQENMMNSAHQREVADLRAAGINPILTADGGSGAGTPNLQPWVPELSPVGNSVNSALDARAKISETRGSAFRQRKEGELINAQKQEIDSRISANSAQAAESEARTLKTIAEIPGVPIAIEKMRAETAYSSNSAKAAANQAEKIRAETAQAQKDEQIYRTPVVGTAVRILEKMAGPATSAISAGAQIRNAGRTNYESIDYDYDSNGKISTVNKTSKKGR